jgi:hypothetical protein
VQEEGGGVTEASSVLVVVGGEQDGVTQLYAIYAWCDMGVSAPSNVAAAEEASMQQLDTITFTYAVSRRYCCARLYHAPCGRVPGSS